MVPSSGFTGALVVTLILLGIATPDARAQKAFRTPEDAALALIDAISVHDSEALRKVLGSDWKDFIPTEGIDQEDLDAFLTAAAKKRSIVPTGDRRAELAVGDSGWTLPIPLVQRGNRWRFDPKAGGEEMRTRRIGRNELAVMQTALAYCDAQREYAERDRNGDGVVEYAQRVRSTAGQHDGLFWPEDGGGQSPLGPLFGRDVPGTDYHGYLFRILTAQGPNAPGGPYDYLIKGRLSGGFALIAWPLRYGDTGVMTFIVNHDGQVYQKDLGDRTDAAARAITRFDPDSTWTKAEVPPAPPTLSGS